MSIKNKSTTKVNKAKSNTATKKDIQDLHELMAKNLFHTQKIERLANKFDKFVFWIKVQASLKFLFIVVPLVLAYFFIVPKLQKYLTEAQGLYKSFIP